MFDELPFGKGHLVMDHADSERGNSLLLDLPPSGH